MSNPLSKFFVGVGAKRLSQVEIDSKMSHQHEFNGINGLRKVLGTEEQKFKAKFIYLSDEDGETIENDGYVKWYDSRVDKPHRSAEYRLYYSDKLAIPNATPGDILIVGKTTENSIVIIIARQESTIEKQLFWLFGLEEMNNKFIVKDFSQIKSDLGFAGKYIISSLGIEVEETAPNYLEEIIHRFGKVFPPTKEFSEYARSTLKGISPIEAPDEALIQWMEREELLFKTLENVIVKERLVNGFGKDGSDVDEFIKFSLSVQNRRKSRAGHSFENHLSVIFKANHIVYEKGAITERNNKPDFLFPGSSSYHNPAFNINLLTMLGVKTTAKDRWRQVLSEAAKISNKHLITLEPSISKNQTDDMIANNLQLVIPKSIMPTYTKEQQGALLSVSDFIAYVGDKQVHYTIPKL